MAADLILSFTKARCKYENRYKAESAITMDTFFMLFFYKNYFRNNYILRKLVMRQGAGLRTRSQYCNRRAGFFQFSAINT